MQGRPQGSARLRHDSSYRRAASTTCDKSVTNDNPAFTEMNAGQRGSSWALPVSSATASRIPAWTSRDHWHALVHLALNTARGTRIRSAQKVSCRSVIAVAVSMSRFANSANGRDVTASNFRLAARAGVSERVVSRARKVLAELGLAVEVERGRILSPIERAAARAHHGAHQSRAASVWYLTIPSAAAARSASAGLKHRSRRRRSKCPIRRSKRPENPQVIGSGDLPPDRGVSSSSSVELYSPTRAVKRGAGEISSNTKQHTPWPLHLQRAAAELVQHGPALGLGHIGAICAALATAGIDTTRYRGRDIAERLTRDTQSRGWTWPNRIARPRAFLAARLAMIDWSLPSPTEESHARAEAARRRRTEAAEQAARRAENAPSTAEHRTRCMEEIRSALRRRRSASSAMKPSAERLP